MQRNKILFIITAITLVIAIYFLGDFKGKNNSKGTNNTKDANRDAPMEMNPTKDIVPLDIDAYEVKAIEKLDANEQTKAKGLAQTVLNANTPVACKDAAEYWEKKNDLNIAAKYYKKGAFLENTEKSITFAGNLFLAILQRTGEAETRKWQALQAIECFNKALEINPNNTDNKIALATSYTDGTGETMKGVTLLREVTQADSNNVSANIILGKLAIQSGQLDKAIKRLERVLSIRPDNTEAMYFLAEAYKNQGNKQKALELFEQCKKLVDNPEFAKEIDSYIKTFK